jgi:formylglycine-generating enzyme required for sulfatase activity
VHIQSDRYQDLQTQVEIKGCGEIQTFTFALLPGWADVSIDSVPQGAKVTVDGNQKGITPLKLELQAGTYDLELNAVEYKTWRTALTLQANQPLVLDPVRLQPADGTLVLRTNPAGANVTVDKTYAGQTPLKMPLSPDNQHRVNISKPGYKTITHNVKLATAAVKNLTFDLEPVEGILHLNVEPPDAELFVNGKALRKSRRFISGELRLVAVETLLEIKKKGYESFRTRITPRPGFPQELNVALKKIAAQPTSVPNRIKAANGYALTLIRPATFTMGSSRREQGRRSNETLRKINLKRPFYMGLKEVTNREYRSFEAGHVSGGYKRQSLSLDDQPVVNVTWEQAARFCNWLSAKDALPPAYVVMNNKIVAVNPLGTGYRLPTEAEWEYCARYQSNEVFQKYSWGNTFPPSANSGNFADRSASGLLVSSLETYDDGFAAAAPPGLFKANALGLYDLGGNVAEWCHDYYSIYSFSAAKVYVDPTGPKEGKHHVVKGSSWKHSSISNLRLSYRDYSMDKRLDLGFRICRYLDDGKGKGAK